MIINIANTEFLIETKVFYSPRRFEEGNDKLAYYYKSLNLNKGIYIVFYPNNITYPPTVKEETQTIDSVDVLIYLVEYDETKW